MHTYIHNDEFYILSTEGAPEMFGSRIGAVTKITLELNYMNLDAN
jgi:hypothetical protein